MSVDIELLKLWQKLIIESGFILDEDLILLRNIQNHDQETETVTYKHGIIALGATLGAFHALKTGVYWKSSIIVGVPVASTAVIYFFEVRRTEKRKKLFPELVNQYENLVKISDEVKLFLEQYKQMIETSSDELLQQNEGLMRELTRDTCEVLQIIVKQMQDLIKQALAGVTIIEYDFSNLETAINYSFEYDNVSMCLQNINVLSDQIILLRSHLLTSIVLVSSDKGTPKIFAKLIDQLLPCFALLVKTGIRRIETKLNEIRFGPPRTLVMDFVDSEQMEQRRNVSIPKMKKHVTKMRNTICLTLLKAQSILDCLDNTNSRSELAALQASLAGVRIGATEFCNNSANLEKLIEFINCSEERAKLQASGIQEFGVNEGASTSQGVKNEESVEFEINTDRVYLNYDGESDDGDSIHERSSINNDVPYLRELKLSEGFKKRQDKLNVVKKIVTPVQEEQLNYAEPSTSGMQPKFRVREVSSSSISLEIPLAPPLSGFLGAVPEEDQSRNETFSTIAITGSYLEDCLNEGNENYAEPSTSGMQPKFKVREVSSSEISLEIPPAPPLPVFPGGVPEEDLSRNESSSAHAITASYLAECLNEVLNRMEEKHEEYFE